MRWTKKQKKVYKHGDTRTKTRFLLFPKCIEDECRWLTIATWKQKLIEDYEIDITGMPYSTYAWLNTEWID